MSAARAVRSEAAEQQKKIVAGAAFVLIAAVVLYFELSDPSPKSRTPTAANVPAVVTTGPTPANTAGAIRSGALVTAPPGNAAGAAARVAGNTSAALDPTLHMQAMLLTESVVYTGSGRNIFAGPGEAAPVATRPIPRPISTARPEQQQPTYMQPSGPPPPLPIDLKFFGTATSMNGHRKAFLLHGDDVFLASDGDIVLRKYRVISVGASAIQVEDLTDNNKQTLPLVTR